MKKIEIMLLNKSYQRFIVYLVLVIILLWGWEISSSNQNLKLLISSPSNIYEFFIININKLLLSSLATLYEATLGLIIAICFSFLIMILCFYFSKLMEFILPIMITSQVIPLITLAPLFILLFGIGFKSKIMMSALICFFPIFINFANGIKLIPKNINELMFVFNATKTQMIRKVFFPLSLPHIISGLKIASTLSVIGAIVAEFNGAEIGLGKNLFIAAKRIEPELMMSSLFLSAFLGAFLYLLIVLIELKFGKWYIKK